VVFVGAKVFGIWTCFAPPYKSYRNSIWNQWFVLLNTPFLFVLSRFGLVWVVLTFSVRSASLKKIEKVAKQIKDHIRGCTSNRRCLRLAPLGWALSTLVDITLRRAWGESNHKYDSTIETYNIVKNCKNASVWDIRGSSNRHLMLNNMYHQNDEQSVETCTPFIIAQDVPCTAPTMKWFTMSNITQTLISLSQIHVRVLSTLFLTYSFPRSTSIANNSIHSYLPPFLLNPTGSVTHSCDVTFRIGDILTQNQLQSNTQTEQNNQQETFAVRHCHELLDKIYFDVNSVCTR